MGTEPLCTCEVGRIAACPLHSSPPIHSREYQRGYDAALASRDAEVARLKLALKDLLDLKEATEMTYEEAYHAMFKGMHPNAWDRARRALDGQGDKT